MTPETKEAAVKAEREACAMLADIYADAREDLGLASMGDPNENRGRREEFGHAIGQEVARAIATAIRARSPSASQAGTPEGVEALQAIDRLSLVIESAVRNADPEHHEAVKKALLKARAVLARPLNATLQPHSRKGGESRVEGWVPNLDYEDEATWPPRLHPFYGLFHNARLAPELGMWQRERYEQIIKLFIETQALTPPAGEGTGVEAAELRQALSTINRLDADLREVAHGIGSTRFMNPPDGGDVSLGEQVRRMREALEKAEAALSTPLAQEELKAGEPAVWFKPHPIAPEFTFTESQAEAWRAAGNSVVALYESSLIPSPSAQPNRLAELEAETPDYCYDSTDWEHTYDWSDREEIFEEIGSHELRKPYKIECLKELPPKFAISVVAEWDDDQPGIWEIEFFDSEEAAIAAREKSIIPALSPTERSKEEGRNG